MLIIEVDGYKETDKLSHETKRYNSIVNSFYRSGMGAILYGEGKGKTHIIKKLLSRDVISDHQIFYGIDDDVIDKIENLVRENKFFILETKELDVNFPLKFEAIYANSVLIHFS